MSVPDKMRVKNVDRKDIRVHRSLRSYEFNRQTLFEMIFLPFVFLVVLGLFSGVIESGWRLFFEFWIEKLNLAATVSTKVYDSAWSLISIPEIKLSVVLPSNNILMVVSAITIATLLLSFVIAEKYLPLRFFLRIVCFIQFTALFFFYFAGEKFLYSASDHIEGLLIFNVLLLLIIPVLHALTYYIFDFKRSQKVLFTIVTLVMLIILVPFQIISHVYLLSKFSLVLLPILYFLCGVILPIMVCIALYGWAMSWERQEN